jgi:chaperonin GroES
LYDVPENMTSAAGKLPIKMLHDRILVALRKEDGDRRSSGGILIPATAQVAKRLVWGEARGIGGSVRQVKVGDQVLFSPEDQHEVEVHGEDLIILRERDVHAVAAERIEESTGLYL